MRNVPLMWNFSKNMEVVPKHYPDREKIIPLAIYFLWLQGVEINTFCRGLIKINKNEANKKQSISNIILKIQRDFKRWFIGETVRILAIFSIIKEDIICRGKVQFIYNKMDRIRKMAKKKGKRFNFNVYHLIWRNKKLKQFYWTLKSE